MTTPIGTGTSSSSDALRETRANMLFKISNDSAVDTLGALTGGELVNGTEEEFVPIE